MKNIVGIDLGTTFSGVSKINSLGRPEIVPNNEAERITASAIFFDPSGKTITGTAATRQSAQDPDRYAEMFKRDMGEEFYRGTDGKPREVAGKKWSPVDLSSILLSKLRSDFEKTVGKIDYAVVTVPAYFDDKRRRATKLAAEKAKINVISIINEPTAAGLYYATQKDINGKTIVFDLGGGTFDVTLLDIAKNNGKNEVDIITSLGDHKLGGKDFDMAIVKDMSTKYKAQYGEEIKSYSQDYFYLMEIAQNLKKDLSKKESVSFNARLPKGTLNYTLKRSEFEKMISPFFEKIEMLCESVLDEAKEKADNIKNVILVGGSSRIPLVTKTIKEVYNLEPIQVGNMDESVALGAALYAGIEMAAKEGAAVLNEEAYNELKGTNVTDVTNNGYGTIVMDRDPETGSIVEVNSILIPKNTKLPHTVTKKFFTMSDNQTAVDINITEGNSESVNRVNVKKKIRMELPSGRPQGQPIEVKYSYDKNGIMHCEFFDVNSGRREEIKLTISPDTKEVPEDSGTYDDLEDYLDF